MVSQKVYSGASDLAKKIVANKSYLIVSHVDADGVTSAAELSIIFKELGYDHEIMFVERATAYIDNIVQRAAKYAAVIICDLGDAIKAAKDFVEKLQKPLFIIDHHEPPEKIPESDEKLNYFNIVTFGMSGDKEACTATMVFLIAKHITQKNIPQIAKLSLVGAVGDIQEMRGLNAIPLSVIKEANIGREIKVPAKGYGISGSVRSYIITHLKKTGREHAISIVDCLLKDAGVSGSDNWQTLTDDVRNKLIVQLKKKAGIEFEDKIIFTDEEQTSPFCNPDEFSTVLNYCVRGGLKVGGDKLALDICLGDRDPSKLEEVENIRRQGAKVTASVLAMIKSGEIPISQEFSYVQYLNIGARFIDKIPFKLTSSISSILSKEESATINPRKYLMVFSTVGDDYSRVSVRAPERVIERIDKGILPSIDDILSKMTPLIFISAGGHRGTAGGGILPTSKIYDAVSQFNKLVEEYVGETIHLEAVAETFSRLARKQSNGLFVSEFYSKKARRYCPGEKVYFVVTVTAVGNVDVNKDVLPMIGKVEVYIRSKRTDAQRYIFPTNNVFVDNSTIYFYTDEVEIPNTLVGDVLVIPLLEVKTPRIKDIITIDTEIKIMDYNFFKWSLGQSKIIYPAIYNYVKRLSKEPKTYIARCLQYISPAKLKVGSAEEKARKISVVTGTIQDCVPEHTIAENLHIEIDRYAKEHNIPDKEKVAAIARVRKMNISHVIRRMCYFGLLCTPYYGRVVDKGKVFEEYLVRPAGVFTVPV